MEAIFHVHTQVFKKYSNFETDKWKQRRRRNYQISNKNNNKSRKTDFEKTAQQLGIITYTQKQQQQQKRRQNVKKHTKKHTTE